MSLSVGTPEPRRRTPARKPAAKKAPARRVQAVSSARRQSNTPQLPDAERLLRRFVQLLPDGEHAFSQLRQDFSEWCNFGDVEPPSHVVLAAWLKNCGLVSYRSGRAKTTVYRKPAARFAA